MSRRNWALRLSIILNICVVLYVCAHLGSWQEEETNWDTAVAVPLVQDNIPVETVQTNLTVTAPQGTDVIKISEHEKHEKKSVNTSTNGSESGSNAIKDVQKKHGQDGPETSPLVQPSISLKDAVGCNDKSLEPRIAQRGDFWVLYNYVPMTMSVKCWETLTYTTHADYTFLDNLEPLLERWKAPVSIAMHAPGNDFQPTLEAIKYSRSCGSPLVSQLVTFHLYFSSKHVPKVVSECLQDGEAVVLIEFENGKCLYTRSLQRDSGIPQEIARRILKSRPSISHHVDPSIINPRPTKSCQLLQLDIGETLKKTSISSNTCSVFIAILGLSEYKHFHVPPSEKISNSIYNCSLGAPWANAKYTNKMYKNEKRLLYPVNVGRNVARESAVTHYLLASDIELYPSPELPSRFLDMIRRRDQPALLKPNPKVFVLPIFEVDEKSLPPVNKTALLRMLKAGSAIPFHKKLCSGCHNVPKSKEWQEAPESDGLHVFHIGKRTGPFVHWEPIFIGTNSDPWYDERLSWEGKSDKMTQGYELCVLDYDFLILDNSFLVHRPGIKIFRKDQRREILTAKTNVLIKKIIVPELKVMYGTRKGCAV